VATRGAELRFREVVMELDRVSLEVVALIWATGASQVAARSEYAGVSEHACGSDNRVGSGSTDELVATIAKPRNDCVGV